MPDQFTCIGHSMIHRMLTVSCALLTASASMPFFCRYSRTGTMAAFRHSSLRSEPDISRVLAANRSIEKSGDKWVPFSICEIVSSNSRAVVHHVRTSLRIFARCSAVGFPTAYCLGIRLMNASSMSCGRLVAPRTIIRSLPLVRPSHKVINSALS